MYNLIMVAQDGVWKSSPTTFSRSRIFEYTSDPLKRRFNRLKGPELKEMLSLPCLFSYERGVPSSSYIGRITNFRKRDMEVRIDFELDSALPAISPDHLQRLEWELDIAEWEFNRTHWAIKDVDLLQELVGARLVTEEQRAVSFFPHNYEQNIDRNYTVRPSAFRIPATGIEDDLISVMRPFDPAFEDVQVALNETCNALELRCFDVKQVWDEPEIIQDVFSLIYRSRAVICDFSNKNPNVFYEAGIAHTLGREVIPIVQNPEDIPFDLRHHRHIQYLPNNEGLESLKRQVTSRIKTLLSHDLGE